MSMMGLLAGTMSVTLGYQYTIFQSPLNVGHLHVPCRFSMEPQDTHRFLLAEIPETGEYNIYLVLEHQFHDFFIGIQYPI